jgi:outer membrane PBP1 activator LpoA protein
MLTMTLTACETTGGAAGGPSAASVQSSLSNSSNSRQLAQAEKLSRERQYAAAAQVYEELAQRSTPELRDRFMLRAAHEWLRANELNRGETLLRQVKTVPPADAPLRGIVGAQVAMMSQRPGQALSELDRIPQPWPREDAPAILELRSQAQFALGKPMGAIVAALDREKLLSDRTDITNNRRMIWDGVQHSASIGANMQVPPGSDRTVAGWLDLGGAALAANRNPFAAQPAFDAWRAKYPEHAANEFLNQYVMPQLRVAVTLPSQIAVVLPLSGPQQVAGQVVRDGLIAALLQQPSDLRPALRVYDSAGSGGVVVAYTQAVADGAKFIVGPLTKDEVKALAISQQVTVPTMALNMLPEQAAPIPNLFQFWPDPADEARQVARRIAAEGLTHGVAILPKSEKGDRVYRAFEAEFKLYGGKLVGQIFYDVKTRDFGDAVTGTLLINESKARARSVLATVGGKFEFEPRPRNDLQFIFIGADPDQGRLLKPTIRFHLVEPVPVFATSDIYEPDATAKANVDLDGVSFPDMPWLIAPDAQAIQLRAALNRYWPGRARDRARLYALGFDTFRLIPLLLSQSTGTPTSQSNGVTGRLSIDSAGQVHRELAWARIVNGQPQLLENKTIEASAPTAAIDVR